MLIDRIVEAELAVKILGRECVDHLYDKRSIIPCLFFSRIGTLTRQCDGYRFLEAAKEDYGRVLEEMNRKGDFSEAL